MKIIPDASDVLRKNAQMLHSIQALVPAETIKQAQNCVDTIKRFLRLTVTGAWGTSRKLENSIDMQVVGYEGGATEKTTVVGIANTEKMPIYWAAQEYGVHIPDRIPKKAKAMHYFGYGQEWYLKHVKGFVITAKHYLTNGFSFASNRAKVSFIALMHRIMPK